MDCANLELNPTSEESEMAGVTAAVLEERVNNHIKFFWAVIAFLVVWMGGETALLLTIRSDVSVLTRPDKLAAAATNPKVPANQAKAVEIIAASRKSLKPLPQSVIEQAGKRFVDVAENDAMAWNTALTFVSYRTTLNTEPPDERGNKFIEATTYVYDDVPGRARPALSNVPHSRSS
jgi:hypothetical protein